MQPALDDLGLRGRRPFEHRAYRFHAPGAELVDTALTEVPVAAALNGRGELGEATEIGARELVQADDGSPIRHTRSRAGTRVKGSA